ncbi:MAG: pimeloyl-ACP methyl ester carboxylesterase [Halioglobus sp.]|jgi:pimeloyl-ACP methyl ester carboxylesterase
MKTNQKINVQGHTINYHFRKERGDSVICFLHGYPTSAQEYIEVMKLIPEEYTVIAHDHLGYGRSAKPSNHNYLLKGQADITLALYKLLGIKNVHLVAHDYGTSVATEIIARNIESHLDINLKSVTLCNGSMLIGMAELRIIQRLLKSKVFGPIVAQLSSAETFHRNMRSIWFDKSKYNQKAMHIHWELLIADGGKKVLPKITRYINQRYDNYDRWIGALKESHLPFHILWAANDPVAVVGMARKLDQIIPESTLTIIEKCGHYPMIEERELWTEKVIKGISNVEC